MRVRITLTGASPLLMHNARLSNPEDQFVMAIKEITNKSERTMMDNREIARLEFFGGLYVGQQTKEPVIPYANLRKCLYETAKARKEGKKVLRAIMPAGFEVPLEYKGPRDPEELYKLEQHRYLTSVGVGRKRIMRMRPRFPQWSLSSEWELLTEHMDFKKLIRLVHEAGLIEGLGDARNQGFGRFKSEVISLEQEMKAAA